MFKTIEITVHERLRQQELVESLLKLGYQREEFVSKQGEFSVRGSLVDIYPFHFQNPIRVEIAFGEIESIRDFIVGTGSVLNAHQSISLIAGIKKRSRESNKETLLTSEDLGSHFYHFKKGDIVVHMDYGISKYLGVKRMKQKGLVASYHALEFSGGEVIYVDLDEPQPIERYVGMEGRKPKLTKLHTKEWARAKERATLALKQVAKDLLAIQAKRSMLSGFAFEPDNDWQRQFEERFPFELTKDQLKAIEETKNDMETEKPMDRLLCGDVGYGKTEVAFRAAFKAVMGGKQVVFLVPTTILAEQHYLNFKKRVQEFPVKIEVLSRFRSKAEQKAILAAAKAGAVDVLIGTHRLLSSDVKLPRLGLLLIDEEQRFGVRHKERFKQMRATVDVLTLTATPIPRTLYLALMGARDMSTIQTPPRQRLAVETEIMEFDEKRIRSAILREMDRGGQIYFVHNRVQSIEKIHDRLQKMVPEARFGLGHGQMHGRDLEWVMQGFMQKKFDCLIATSIIESGIDIPNANTIIVDRADLFGLADLYQLRGRVGRYQEKRKAYAYFLIPKGFRFTEEAAKRLAAIEQFTELGSGFDIAMKDLEIRGAGNVLGHEQSGYIFQVGFDLYCRLLKKMVDEEKKSSSTIK